MAAVPWCWHPLPCHTLRLPFGQWYKTAQTQKRKIKALKPSLLAVSGKNRRISEGELKLRAIRLHVQVTHQRIIALLHVLGVFTVVMNGLNLVFIALKSGHN